MPRDIVIIGTGKLATNLLGQLVKCDFFRVFLIGRNSHKLNLLLTEYLGITKLEYSEIPVNSTCIICVSDSSIAEVSRLIPRHVSLVVHSSGSIALNEMSAIHPNSAVVWPLQSFTNQEINWNTIPLIVEINKDAELDALSYYLKALGGPVSILDSEHRIRLHLAAVIVNNFSNHIFSLAQDYCTKNDLPFSALQPLIEQTVARIGQGNLSEFQTGPANRNDQNTIAAHLELLKDDKVLMSLYSTISGSIINSAKNKRADN